MRIVDILEDTPLPSKQTVALRLDAALQALMENDAYLLEVDVSERCIAARLGVYLQGVFPGFAVDVEYNRLGKRPKELGLDETCANHRDEAGFSLVYPDIIVHRRGPEGPNVLALELKKTSNPTSQDCDIARAIAYRKQLGYLYAATILLDVRKSAHSGKATVRWAT